MDASISARYTPLSKNSRGFSLVENGYLADDVASSKLCQHENILFTDKIFKAKVSVRSTSSVVKHYVFASLPIIECLPTTQCDGSRIAAILSHWEGFLLVANGNIFFAYLFSAFSYCTSRVSLTFS